MARPRASDYDDKRKALLAVAARLFAARGFDRTSTAGIAAKARVSKALLYHYYPSKSALLYDIIREHLAYVADALAAVDDPSALPERHLYQLVRATLIAYNWAYLWFRDDGKLSREDYARFATRLFIDGVAQLKEAEEPADGVRFAKADAEKA